MTGHRPGRAGGGAVGDPSELAGGYERAEVWEESSDLAGIPAWQFLTRPGAAHVRVHIGEVDLLLQIAERG